MACSGQHTYTNDGLLQETHTSTPGSIIMSAKSFYIYMPSQVLTAFTKLRQRIIRLTLAPINRHIGRRARIEKAIGTLHEGKSGECIEGLFEERHVDYACMMKTCVESKNEQELKSFL